MKNHLEIVVDSNEAAKDKKYITYLRRKAQELNQSVQTYQLEVGDIRIGDILIEYKTPQDLMSYQDGSLRVMNQAKRMMEMVDKGFTIGIAIVGNFSVLIKRHGARKFYRQKQPQYYGIINTLQWKLGIPVFQFKDNTHFQTWLNIILTRQIRGRGLVTYSLRHTPSRIKNIKEEVRYVLQGVKGLGGAKTEKIIKNGTTNLIDTLIEIAYPYEHPEMLVAAQLVKKWTDLLGIKTYQHLQKVLLYEIGEKK